jgi:two-component system response regulator RegA
MFGDPDCRSTGSVGVILVEDDKHFSDRLARALNERGYAITTAFRLADARDQIRSVLFSAALLDFKLPDGSGLSLIPELLAANPAMRIIVMSGYATLSSAVIATRAGAIEYLVKPVDVDEIDAMLSGANTRDILDPHKCRDPNEIRWRHIETTLRITDGNVSKAARTLSLHRRTLQRILAAGLGKPKAE